MNRLAAVAAVLAIALVALWAWGVFDTPVDGEWVDRTGAGKQPPGTLVGSRTPDAAKAQAAAASPAERDTLAEATLAADAPALLVTVLDNFGRTVTGATVWRWREPEAGGAEPAQAPDAKTDAKTDAQGRACLPSSPLAGGIVVLAKGHPAVVRRLDSLRGEHEVKLEAGARVQGWIRVDGNPPAEPILLRLYGRGPTDPLAGVPDSLRRIVWPRLSESNRILTTTAHGAFEFLGLEQDWEGGISLPQYLWLRGESLREEYNQTIYKLDKPRTGLQLDATLLPGVRGRVVWDDTSEAVKTFLTATAEFANGESSGACGCATDERGYFRVGFGPGSFAKRRAWTNGEGRQPIRKVTLDVSVAGARALHREISEVASEIELRLPRANTLCFRIVDTAGRPLAGAALKGVRPSKASGADGRGEVEVKDLGQRRFLAAAPGHLVAEVEARNGVGSKESPLEFVLAKGNKLVVVVRDASDQVPRDVYLSVRCKEPLATGSKAGRFTDLHRFVGTPTCGATWGGSSAMDFWFIPNDSGEVVLGSLRPNIPCKLVLVDKLSQDALLQDAVTPGEGQVGRIELRLKGEPRDLTGLVVDDQGRPVPGAQVVAMFGSRGRVTKTDDKGSFRLEGGYPTGNTFTLKVSHRGYVRTQVEDLKITSDLEPIEVRLLPGHDVEVTFVDADGVRLPIMGCRVNGKHYYRDTQRLEPGRVLLKDLPPEPVVLSIEIGGRKYELSHHPATSNRARFVLPAMGRCQVEMPCPARPPWDEIRVKVTARSDGQSFSTWFEEGSKGKPLHTQESLLLPGEYTVEVRANESAASQLLCPARQITVKAGKLTVCRFGQ